MTEEVKEKKETFSLEEGLEKIERLLERLTDREVTLEESFRLYQEGMELLKQCNTVQCQNRPCRKADASDR